MRFDEQEGKSASDNGGTHAKQDNGIVMQRVHLHPKWEVRGVSRLKPRVY